MGKKKGKVKVSLALDVRIVRAIDEVRGPISRSSFVEFLVEEGLKAYGSKSGGGLGKG